MILFLRDEFDKTVLDVELFIKTGDPDAKSNYLELRSLVLIEGYSRLLFKNLYRFWEVSQTFAELQELRGWMWEKYFSTHPNNGSDEDLTTVLNILRPKLKAVAEKYKLHYVED